MDRLLLPRRQGRYELDVVVLQYTQAERAQSVLGGQCGPVHERHGHALLRRPDLSDRRVQPDLPLGQELGGLGLDERLESALVDGEEVLS